MGMHGDPAGENGAVCRPRIVTWPERTVSPMHFHYLVGICCLRDAVEMTLGDRDAASESDRMWT